MNESAKREFWETLVNCDRNEAIFNATILVEKPFLDNFFKFNLILYLLKREMEVEPKVNLITAWLEDVRKKIIFK